MIEILANAGTPLLWLSCSHLVLLNLLIGVFEAWALRRWAGPTHRSATTILILANYASAWAMVFVRSLMPADTTNWGSERITLDNLAAWHAVAIAGVFLASLVIEWPFVFAALSAPRGVWKSLRANLLIQSVSHALLAPCYALLTSFMLAPWGPVRVAQLADVVGADSAWWVYYVSPDHKQIRRIRLDGTDEQFVATAPGADSHEPIAADDWMLFARQNSADAPWSLCVWSAPSAEALVVLPAFASDMPIPRRDADEGLVAASEPAIEYPLDVPRPPRFWGSSVDHRRHTEFSQILDVFTGLYADEGLWVRRRAERSRRYAIETPFLASWTSRHASILPGDRVVYALGPRIVVLDVPRERIAPLTSGSNPLVVADAAVLDGRERR